MRLGMLIIGALYWDRCRVRCRWRQNRLACNEQHRVKVPIRYGKKSDKRNKTYTMVFAGSCSQEAKLGTGLIIPARAECCEPEHLFDEAEHLRAAEQDKEEIGSLCAGWGKVCVLKNPKVDLDNRIVQAWQARVRTIGSKYTALPTANGEDSILDATTGLALFEWPKDAASKQDLVGFDLLLMTVTMPTLDAGEYPTVNQIARAWRADTHNNVLYFYNNRHYGITTFQDDQIQALLSGEPEV